MNPSLIFGALVAVAAVCAVAIVMKKRQRAQDLQRAALARGMTWCALDQPFTDDEKQQILRFTRRAGHRCHCVARGSIEGLETIYFEHHARNGGHESVAAFRLALPDFELVLLRHAVNPAVMAPVFSRLGFTVVNFASDAEFTRTYLLIGRDEQALRSIFSDTLRSFFCVPAGKRHWAAESGGGWIFVYRPDRLIEPANLGRFLDEAALVVTAVRRETAHPAFAG